MLHSDIFGIIVVAVHLVGIKVLFILDSKGKLPRK